MRLTKWRCCVVLSVVAFSSSVYLATRPQPRISEEQFAMIRVGMTLGEVESVLGCKPGDHSLAGDLLPMNPWCFGKDLRASYEEWTADMPSPRYTDGNGTNRQDALSIRVWFGENGRAIDKFRVITGYTAPSMSSQAKRWIERVWKAMRR